MLSLVFAWINIWTNNRVVGRMRHIDVYMFLANICPLCLYYPWIISETRTKLTYKVESHIPLCNSLFSKYLVFAQVLLKLTYHDTIFVYVKTNLIEKCSTFPLPNKRLEKRTNYWNTMEDTPWICISMYDNYENHQNITIKTLNAAYIWYKLDVACSKVQWTIKRHLVR